MQESIYQSILASIRPSVNPSVHPSVHPSLHPSVRISVHPCILPPVQLCIHSLIWTHTWTAQHTNQGGERCIRSSVCLFINYPYTTVLFRTLAAVALFRALNDSLFRALKDSCGVQIEQVRVTSIATRAEWVDEMQRVKSEVDQQLRQVGWRSAMSTVVVCL
jgi:hypothetical protein